MPVSKKEIENKLRSKFEDAEIDLIDTVGDSDHYKLVIRSSAFNDKTRIEQHRLVKEALQEYLSGALHALSIQTKPKD